MAGSVYPQTGRRRSAQLRLQFDRKGVRNISDDRLTCDSVQAHLHCLTAHPEVGFMVGEIEWIDSKGSYTGTAKSKLLKQNHYEELLKVNHVANTIAVMFCHSVLEHVGGFDAER